MNNDIIRVDTVEQYNRLFGLKTVHPLVSVVDLKEATRFPVNFTVNYGIYALFLKETKCGDLRYGRQTYDYQEGTVTSFAPGQVVSVVGREGMRPAALGLLFHPDLLKGTSLGKNIRRYSFFSYSSTEALHMSDGERAMFTDCLDMIKSELCHPADRHSRRLLARGIELLLDYCMRFYDRQFATRVHANRDTLTRFETLLDDYFDRHMPQSAGLPTVKYFAEKVCLSPNYFGDLIKKSTGKSPQEYIQDKLVDVAKEQILGTDKTVSQIAFELGFQYTQHFNRLFKRHVGCPPLEYRKAAAS